MKWTRERVEQLVARQDARDSLDAFFLEQQARLARRLDQSVSRVETVRQRERNEQLRSASRGELASDVQVELRGQCGSDAQFGHVSVDNFTGRMRF